MVKDKIRINRIMRTSTLASIKFPNANLLLTVNTLRENKMVKELERMTEEANKKMRGALKK